MMELDERNRPNFTKLLGWMQQNYNIMNNSQPQREIHVKSPTPNSNYSSIDPTGQPANQAPSYNEQDEWIRQFTK